VFLFHVSNTTLHPTTPGASQAAGATGGPWPRRFQDGRWLDGEVRRQRSHTSSTGPGLPSGRGLTKTLPFSGKWYRTAFRNSRRRDLQGPQLRSLWRVRGENSLSSSGDPRYHITSGLGRVLGKNNSEALHCTDEWAPRLWSGGPTPGAFWPKEDEGQEMRRARRAAMVASAGLAGAPGGNPIHPIRTSSCWLSADPSPGGH
jgi:hypothetical protein